MISLIIPHWAYKPEHDALLHRCVRSMDADEVLIIVNDGIGMGKAINKGLALAHGDYLVVANNDTTLAKGSLHDLCDPESITVPQISNTVDQKPRSFYCLPRWVYEQIGGYDEQFERGYFEDDDLIRRWEAAHIPIRSMERVVVDHVGGATLNEMEGHTSIFAANKQRYDAKWADV